MAFRRVSLYISTFQLSICALESNPMVFFRRSVNEKAEDSARSSSNDVVSSHEIVSTAGDLKFVVEQGGNGSQPSYQEVSGAPVEANSSLGYAVGPVTIVLINISKMIGTGVYSTRTYSYPLERQGYRLTRKQRQPS